jgi:hypothetical protein
MKLHVKWLFGGMIIVSLLILDLGSTLVVAKSDKENPSKFTAVTSQTSPLILSEDSTMETNIGSYILTLQDLSLVVPVRDEKSTPTELNFLLPKQENTKAAIAKPPTVTVSSDEQCYVSQTLPFTKRSMVFYANAVFDQDLIIYVKAKTDNLIEPSQQCIITHSYDFPSNSANNFSVYQEIAVDDFTPGFTAVSTPLIYEAPKDATQSSSGQVEIQLLKKPSDLEPVLASLSNQTPSICSLNASELSFTQENFDTKQVISVESVKDGIYQKEARDCVIKVSFTSNEGEFTQPETSEETAQTKKIQSVKPKFVRAAQEYNNLSYLTRIQVLDSDAPAVVAQKLAAQAELVKTGINVSQLALVSVGIVAVLGAVWIAKKQ